MCRSFKLGCSIFFMKRNPFHWEGFNSHLKAFICTENLLLQWLPCLLTSISVGTLLRAVAKFRNRTRELRLQPWRIFLTSKSENAALLDRATVHRLAVLEQVEQRTNSCLLTSFTWWSNYMYRRFQFHKFLYPCLKPLNTNSTSHSIGYWRYQKPQARRNLNEVARMDVPFQEHCKISFCRWCVGERVTLRITHIIQSEPTIRSRTPFCDTLQKQSHFTASRWPGFLLIEKREQQLQEKYFV